MIEVLLLIAIAVMTLIGVLARMFGLWWYKKRTPPTPNPRFPATIRNKNPGAMYPGAAARAFGSHKFEVIGGGHKIATFDTWEAGVAATLWLIYTKYVGLTVDEAIKKWSGGHNHEAYAAFVKRHLSTPINKITRHQLVNNQTFALRLVQALLKWETGPAYKAHMPTEEQLQAGYKMFRKYAAAESSIHG